MSMSVPGDSCRAPRGCNPCNTPNTGCVVRVPGECVYYSGTNITAPGINTGDTFNTVVNDLVQYIQQQAGSLIANNGLTLTSGVVQLGGSLIKETSIAAGPYQLSVTGSRDFIDGATFSVTNTGSIPIAISGSTTAGRAIQGIDSTNGTGVYGLSSSGIGLFGYTQTGDSCYLEATDPSLGGTLIRGLLNNSFNSQAAPWAIFNRGTTGSSAAGLGGSIDFNIQASNGILVQGGQIVVSIVDPTISSFDSKIHFYATESSVNYQCFTINGRRIEFNNYGLGVFTGATAYLLATTNTGQIIEVPDVSTSTDSTSKYLLSEPTNNVIYFNGTKMRDISSNTPILMFALESGGITDGIHAVVKNGAMTTATINKLGDFDRIAVTGGDSTSYLQLDKQCTLNQYNITLRVQINSIGTAPLLGMRGIWPGLTYSNFNNTQYFAYVNLATGAITTQTGGTITTFNGFLGTVATGDIIELTLLGDYLVGQTLTVKKLNGFTGEVSEAQSAKITSQTGWVYHCILSMIMADGDYTLLEYSVSHTDTFKPKLCVLGDSMSSGIQITKADSVIGKLKSKIPYRASSIGAGSCLLKGTLATMYELLGLYPEYVALFFYLDPIFYDKANSGNGDYATFSADLARFMGLVKQAGMKPIFVYPQTWAIIDPSGTKCSTWETFLNTFYASERKIKVLTSESFYDGTGFHYNGTTNGIIADKIIALLESEGAL